MRENILVAFGSHVRKLRRNKEISQEELASRAGFDRSYMGKVERGEINITLVKICELASALDVPPSDLLGSVDFR